LSVVTNLILHLGLADEDKINDINRFFQRGEDPDYWPQGLTSVSDPSLPKGWYGGNKYLEVRLFIGAYNHLDLQAFLAHLRRIEFSWPRYVQLMVCEQESSRFELINLFDDPTDPSEFAPPPLTAFGQVRRVLFRPMSVDPGRSAELILEGTGDVGIAISPDPFSDVMRVTGRRLLSSNLSTYDDVTSSRPWPQTIGKRPVSLRRIPADDMSAGAVQIAFLGENPPADGVVLQIHGIGYDVRISELRLIPD
jgi:hypothetical protein